MSSVIAILSAKLMAKMGKTIIDCLCPHDKASHNRYPKVEGN